MAIISKRGKEAAEKHPTKPWPFPKPEAVPEVEQFEINFAEFDDYPRPDRDQQAELDLQWIVDNKSKLFAPSMFDAAAARAGCMTLEPRTNVVSIWNGTKWLKTDYYHLQNLLRPKTQRVTMGQHEYEVVVK